MVIGTCTLELLLPGNGSLKDKRRVVKSITQRVQNNFNVSIAEIGAQDLWQRTVLGIACISNNAEAAHRLLTNVVEWVTGHYPQVEMLDYEIEIL
ncbi:MAG: DUF503 domain-containing protein [Chloroflexi bacterium]|nr:MAG: DUF503 domain-containing protein [Chloroflexota bacterium]HDN78911.1 DUF503 domain-containing protein [Chloroflexota bacterium]